MLTLQKLHYCVGIIFFIVFLLTGAYMLLNFPELYVGREEVRMMFRATHLYLLFSALINLVVGNALLAKDNESDSSRRFLPLWYVASLLILIAPGLFLVGFIVEPPSNLIERPVSFWGVISLLVGVMMQSLLTFQHMLQNKQ